MVGKKSIKILIISIISIILILTFAIISLMYFNTDIFKSNNELFVRYIMNNIENINDIISTVNEDEFNTKIKNNKYTSDTNVKFNFIQNINSSSQDTSNSINDFNISINGKTDKLNSYNYQEIKLLNNNEEKMKIEYINDDDIYGVKFPELFEQYILVENSNLKELFKNMNYENLSNISDKIEINDDLFSYINFTDEEIQQLNSKYMKLLEEQIIGKKISKGSNQIITVNDQQIEVKPYYLSLTKEQINDFFLKILEIMKQDEVILNKLDNIDNLLSSYYMITKKEDTTSIKEKFLDNIDDLITQINETNIGNDETKIIVYESNKTTVKTTIEYIDYEINLDVLQLEDNKYIQFNIENNKTSKTKTVKLQKNKESSSIEIVNDINGNINKTTINQAEKVDSNMGSRNILFNYEDESNKIETTLNENIEFVDDFDKINTEENSIKLNNIESERLQLVLNQIQTTLSEKINSIITDENKNDLNEILKILGIARQEKNIEFEGITETEKNRFNSKFEILKGKNIDSERIISIIDGIKENIIGLDITSNTQLKIQLDKNNVNNENDDIATRLKNFLQDSHNSNYKYDVDLEYDDKGLVKYIVINIVVE